MALIIVFDEYALWNEIEFNGAMANNIQGERVKEGNGLWNMLSKTQPLSLSVRQASAMMISSRGGYAITG